MATLATFFRRSDWIELETTREETAADQYRLRRLPGDDVYFFSKRIDNSRLVRQADSKTRKDCWSAIGTACLVAVLLGSAVSPRIGGVLAGYRTERLKKERQTLLDQRRTLEIQEAQLVSPARLSELASKGNLAAPAATQEIRLEPKPDAALALNEPVSLPRATVSR